MPIARRAEPESDPSTPPAYGSAKCARSAHSRSAQHRSRTVCELWNCWKVAHKCHTFQSIVPMQASKMIERLPEDRTGHGSIESPPNHFAPALALRPASPVGQVLPQRARPRVRLRVPQHLVRASAPPRPRRACIARRNHARCAHRSPSGMHPNASQRHSEAPACVGHRRARRCTWLSRLQRATRRGGTVGCTRRERRAMDWAPLRVDAHEHARASRSVRAGMQEGVLAQRTCEASRRPCERQSGRRSGTSSAVRT